MQRLPRRERADPRAEPGRFVRPPGAAGHGRDRHGGRPLPARFHPAAAKADRRQLRADHAELRRPDRRGGGFPVDPVHQEPGRTIRPTNTSDATSRCPARPSVLAPKPRPSRPAPRPVRPRTRRRGCHAGSRADAAFPAAADFLLKMQLPPTAHHTISTKETTIRSWLLTTDHKRIALLVSVHDPLFLSHRRGCRRADARSNC